MFMYTIQFLLTSSQLMTGNVHGGVIREVGNVVSPDSSQD